MIIHITPPGEKPKVCSCGYVWSWFGCEPGTCRAPCMHPERELRSAVVVCLKCNEPLPRIYPDRNLMHRNMGPPEYYPCCGGRGYFETGEGERYCDCEAGNERKRVER